MEIQAEQENIQTPQQLRLNKIFGSNSKISIVENDFIINNVLTDGISAGGQKVNASVLSEQIIPNPSNRICGKGKNIRSNQIKSLIINGTEIITENKQVYLYNRNTLTEETEAPDLLLDIFSNSFCDEKKVIFISRFSSADDLTMLLHEMGHVSNPQQFENLLLVKNRLSELAKKRQSYIQEILRKRSFVKTTLEVNKPKTPISTDEESNFVYQLLTGEKLASENAIKEVETKSELFPNDVGLFRFKKCLTTALITYLDSNILLSDEIRNKANEIINL